MKRRTVLTGMAAGLAMPMLARKGFAKGIKLRVADSFPTTHQYSINCKAWLDRVTELTEGEVTFEYFPAQQLAKSADLLDAAQNRIADIVYVPPLYQSARLPLSTVAALPMAASVKVEDMDKLNQAWFQMMTDQLNEKELMGLGVRGIRAMVTAPYQIMGRTDKFETLEQLDGKKLRSSGGVQERSVKALGAVPVGIPAPDLYPALQRGTVDGTLFNIPTAMGYNLQEQLMWATGNLNLGLFPIFYAINEDVWQDLSTEVQTALIDGSKDVQAEVLSADTKRAADFTAALEAKGGGVYDVKPEQFALWNERLAPVREDWVSGLEAQNKPATEVLEAWSALIGA